MAWHPNDAAAIAKPGGVRKKERESESERVQRETKNKLLPIERQWERRVKMKISSQSAQPLLSYKNDIYIRERERERVIERETDWLRFRCLLGERREVGWVVVTYLYIRYSCWSLSVRSLIRAKTSLRSERERERESQKRINARPGERESERE